MKLIVGLGNPGKRYERTRHNLGFLVIDRLANRHDVTIKKMLCGALVGDWSLGGENIVLAKPQTFMNRSGAAVDGLLKEYGATAENLAVVYDDLDLSFGRVRIRARGSAAGHRGVLSIIETLAGAQFYRVRVGIGRPPDVLGLDPVDYVLQPFGDYEMGELNEIVDRAADSVVCLLRDGARRAMELYNRVR
jgi:PTH1 family peptidyl-tRNA hydrolase